MMYLEQTLTDDEQRKFLDWIRQLRMKPTDICSVMETHLKHSFCIDVSQLDNALHVKLPHYDADNCTYNGKAGYSCKDVILEEFGQEILDVVQKLV